MKIAAYIPARMGSSRFPGKPLAELGGFPLVEFVRRRVAAAVDDVFVATSDSEIVQEVGKHGGKTVLTSSCHRNGTNRVAEAARLRDEKADVIVSVQGDEPFVSVGDIEALVGCFDSEDVGIATLANVDSDITAIADPGNPKVVVDARGFALYFSRSVIPHSAEECLLHRGVYAFRREILQEIALLPESPLEKAERLEQLTWLYNGYRIKVAASSSPSVSIDTPADLLAARKLKHYD